MRWQELHPHPLGRVPRLFQQGGEGPASRSPDGGRPGISIRALDRGDKDEARTAAAHLKELLPKERFGDEYSAFLSGICDYLLGSPEEKEQLVSDPCVADYFRSLGGDDFAILKKYVLQILPRRRRRGRGEKPRLRHSARGAGVSQDQLNDWGEFIAFNNPRRETWERTGEVLKFLNLRSGSSVADIGCGPGYYTFKSQI